LLDLIGCGKVSRPWSYAE